MCKYDFAVLIGQLMLILIISNKGEVDSFHSRLMLLMIAVDLHHPDIYL